MDWSISTARLRLRPPVEADIPVMLAELNKMVIARNTARIPHPYHRDDALDYLRFVAGLDDRSRVAAVEEQATPGVMIGIASYEWSAAKDDAELGYWLAEHVWGRGYASEAVAALVEDAFLRAGHGKMVACYHDDNPASGRVLAKAGFGATGACSSFSKAQGREVPVTNVVLTQARWLSLR
ncbi:MAG: GNAT family N-acetyltransferase [Hyphomicrobiales bacterium]